MRRADWLWKRQTTPGVLRPATTRFPYPHAKVTASLDSAKKETFLNRSSVTRSRLLGSQRDFICLITDLWPGITSVQLVIRHLGHWRRVHARLGQALEIVLVHRLHFGGRGPHATELREFLEARFSQSF